MSSISNISRNVEVHHTDDLAASASTDQLLEVVKQTKLNDQTFVYFGNKGLTVLPADLDLLQHLTHLNLESNLLTGLPSQIARLVNLVNLELNNNRISSIPNDIVGLSSLLHLNLDNNRIGYLPSTLGKLTSLRTLKINKNQLSSEGLDPIFTLHRLEHLEIGDNQLEEIPPMISHLASLKILNLAGNKLTQLPECINTLTQLSKLLIERNQIDEFPPTFGNTTTLTEICVAQNCISELPETFPQLTGLRKLDLSSNLLYSFGSGFLVWALTNLTELNLIKSRLPDLPPEIANLSNLVQLNLEFNSIEFLPPEIGKLTALKRLNLANNKLVTLPNEMESLTKLQYLMLNHNKLEWLPYQLGSLDLKKLEVVGNPLETIPEEIVKKGMTHIIGYLRELRGSKTSWNRLKLVFVGQEFVGKTSLLRCFTAQVALKSKQTFRSVRSKVPVRAAHTGDTLATDGIDIAEWNPRIRIKGTKLVSILNTESSSVFTSTDKLKSKKSILTRDVRSETSVNTIPEEDLQLKFSAWDFAGQEIYYPTHQFFISPRSIYLIVFNMVDEQSSRVEYWLNTVQSRAANPTVILVGTHLDDKRCTSTFVTELQSSFEERYKKRFPCIKAVTFVSCHTSKGLEELKDTLINTALKEKVLSQRVPLSYLMMAQVVEKEKKTRPILRWSTFEKMALNAGISEDGVEIATEFLHDVGVLIHFKDPLLKNFVFLNPQYLANVMSSVITLKHQFVKDGLLKHSNLPHIWSHYPQENYPLLLKVLQKFEIMFKMPSENSEEVSLIPSLLPVEQPAGVAEQWPSFWPETSLSRVYQFKFLPLGFFSRLMTRALHLPGLTPLFYWSTGVLVQYENVKALIKYSANNYKLTLIVRSATENSSPPLLRLLVENIDTLAQGWYEAKVQVSVICSHCLAKKDLSYDPFQFSLDECSEAVRTGHGVVMCRGIRPVRVDYIAPDISFQDFPGRKIPYEDIQTSKILGKGAFGTVLLGILDGEEVAVKVMHDGPAEPGTDEANSDAAEGFAEFQREVFIMSCLNHPNLVNLIGICLKPLAMVMECIRLGTLYHALADEKLEFNPKLRLKIVYDIAKGMEYLHSVTPAIIHRDLRSPNVLLKCLDEDASVVAKVADFGLARFLAPTIAGGEFNINWLAPEVVRGEEYNTKADVYSFGIICWELLTRSKPFEEYDGRWPGPWAFRKAIIDGLRPTISEEREKGLPELCFLIRRCWDDTPASRPDFGEVVKIMGEITGDVTEQRVGQVEILKLTAQPGSLTDSTEIVSTPLKRIAALKEKLTPCTDGAVLAMLLVDDYVWTGCGDGQIWVWDKSGKAIKSFQAHQKRVYSLALVPDVKRVFSVGEDLGINVWDGKSFKLLKKKAQVHKEIIKIAKAIQRGDECLVWTGSTDGYVKVWNKSLQLKRELKLGKPVTAIARLDSCVYVATFQNVFVFDSETFTPFGDWDAHNELINDMVATQEHIWTCASDKTIKVWGKEGELIKTLEGHNGKVHVLAVVGNYVWSGSWDKTIMIWDKKSLKFVQEVEVVHTDAIRSFCQVSKDTVWSGAASFDKTICVWKLT